MFKLNLKEIKHIKTDYWNDKISELPNSDGKSFKMIIHPTAEDAGYYIGDGLFWVNPFYLQIDSGKLKLKAFDPLPLHEIFHGFFGGRHSGSSDSTMRYPYLSIIGLAEEEAKHLGWPIVKPVDVHPLRLRDIYDLTTNTKKIEVYRD